MARIKPPREWSFLAAFFGVLGAVLYLGILISLGRGLRAADGGWNTMAIAGFAACLVPFVAMAIFRTFAVWSFLRSIRVGVTVMVFMLAASGLGVLIHQEDPLRPVPPPPTAEMDAAAAARVERNRENHYLDFRHAQAFFLHHMLHPYGLGIEPKPVPQEKLDRLPIVGELYGEDVAVSLEKQTYTAYATQAHNIGVDAIELDWDDSLRAFWGFCDSTDLLRVWKADWFAGLWLLLFLSVLINTFRFSPRQWFTWKRLGFIASHAGILLIVGGGWVSRTSEVRGSLEMNLGDQPKAWFVGYDGIQRILGGEETPFGVRLDGFRADYHDMLEVAFYEGHEGHRRPVLQRGVPQERVWNGKRMAYDASEGGEERLTVEVLEYHPAADVRPRLVEDRMRADEFDPAVQLDDGDHLAILRPGAPEEAIFRPHDGSFVMLYQTAGSLTEAESFLATPVVSRLGVLSVGVHDETFPIVLSSGMKPAVVTTAAGTYRIELLLSTPAFRLDENHEILGTGADAATMEPTNPAIQIRATAPGGGMEERWVFDRFEMEHHVGGEKLEELSLSFDWDYWAGPAQERRILVHAPGGELLFGAPGGTGISVAAGDKLAVPGGTVALASFADVAKLEPDVTPRPDASFFDDSPGFVRLRVTSPSGEEEVVLSTIEGQQEHIVEYDRNGAPFLASIAFFENRSDMPNEWRSDLTILEDEGDSLAERAAGEIRVNDYLYYRGYRFFQSNADPNRPMYSGIGVVYDPGIETVIAGLYLVMFGCFYAFLIRPLFERGLRR